MLEMTFVDLDDSISSSLASLSCILGLVSSKTTWTDSSTLKVLLLKTRKALLMGA